jgi:predicted nuclease of predicted toxin-antitoxin system
MVSRAEGFRILADENIERATVTYLRKLGHDVDWVRDVPELGVGSDDTSIAEYAVSERRLILTQDDDFFTELNVDEIDGVLFQKDQTLSARTVGDIVHELSQYLDQTDITLEYVSSNWL